VSENKTDIAVVVNGVSADVTVNVKAPLRTIIPTATQQTDQDRGHTPNDWEVKLNGQPLDLDKKIEDYAFPPGTVLYIDLRAGGGG
jgi:hypothetical protein